MVPPRGYNHRIRKRGETNVKSKAHKPDRYHPWGYATWEGIEKGKRNYWDFLRIQAKLAHLSADALLRLEWIIFYYTAGNKNVSATSAHFGIARKTLRQWLSRFESRQVASLEGQSTRPKKLRSWLVTKEEETNIISLRKENMEFGKAKLKVLYKQRYKKTISTWKIERVMRKHQLFPRRKKHKLYRVGRSKQKRIRIHTVKERLKQLSVGQFWHTDSVLIWWYGKRRYIFTAIENRTKMGYARVYSSHSSMQAADFLRRLRYLSENRLVVIHSDNGPEFAKDFTDTCISLGIEQVFSRPHTPKDNPALEKFNHTVQREWLEFSDIGLDDISDANADLTEWLVKYNSIRPHQALDYKTPLAYAYSNYPQLVPKSPASSSV